MKRTSPNIKKPSVLFHFTLSYIIIFLIPVFMGFISYHNILKITMDRTTYSNMLILRNCMNTIENSLNSVTDYCNTLIQVSIFDKVNQLENKDEVDILDLQEVIKEFPQFQDDNKYIKYYFYYDKEIKIALAPNKAFLDPEMYYGSYFDFGNMSFAEWKKQILENSINSNRITAIYNLSNSANSVHLFYQIPYFNRDLGTVPGHLFFIIDEQKIKSILGQAFELGAGFMYILNEKDQYLVSMESKGWETSKVGNLNSKIKEGTFESEINGKKMVITYLKSRNYGWTYIIAIPKAYLVSAARKSLSPIILLTFILALSCTIFIFAVYRYNQRPLMNIVKNIDFSGSYMKNSEKKGKPINGLWYLANNISALITNKGLLEEKLEKQKQQLREAFFIQLVCGELMDEENLAGRMAEYGVEATGKCFRGIYLEFPKDRTDDMGLGREELNEIIHEFILKKTKLLLPCFWVDENHLTLLYICPRDEADEKYGLLLKEIYLAIKDNYGMEIMFFTGGKYDCLHSIHFSFTEARKLLINKKNSSMNIFFLNEYDQKGQAGYKYTKQDEDLLLECASLGRFNEIKNILDRIYKSNFLGNNISLYMRELLISRIVSTLACSPWNAEFIIGRHKANDFSNESFFSALLYQYGLICNENLNMIQKRQEDIKNKIMKYIDSNYCDSSLSLKTLSLQFGMTESYLSTFIKNLIGEPFSCYLEKLRINRANLLLKDQKLSISEIGYKVGYDSTTSFGRAYKRVMGYNASQYRKLNTYLIYRNEYSDT